MKNLLLLFGILIANRLHAQLSITTGDTPAAIVAALVDPILNPSNATISGKSTAFGRYFASGLALTKVGSQSGVILTTGKTADANKDPSNTAGSYNEGQTDDTELSTIDPSRKYYDKCVLEFDINSQVDSISILYVFASEEYYLFCEPTDFTYSDVFGFFIKPNPVGVYQNIAYVPGTVSPVSVQTIHPGGSKCGGTAQNEFYFVDNTSAQTGVVYNGLTKQMKAVLSLQKNTSYHIKIVIADAGDTYLDAALFIKTITSLLPAELIRFQGGKNISGKNILQWETASEKNVNSFEVLRSVNAKNYKTIGTVPAVGNSVVQQTYSFEDPGQTNENAYYRLMVKDDNGKIKYSEIIIVKPAAYSDFAITIKAELENAQLHFNMPFSGFATINLFNIQGQKIETTSNFYTQGPNHVALQFGNIASGIYFAQINTETGQTSKTIKFVK